MKQLLVLFTLAAGIAAAQRSEQPPAPDPLRAVPAPLLGALLDLYANYQQNRPALAPAQEDLAVKAEQARQRTVKVASGVAIGSAIGAMVAKPGDRGKSAAIGAVAGGVAAWIVEHYQAKREERAAAAPPPDPNDTGAL